VTYVTLTCSDCPWLDAPMTRTEARRAARKLDVAGHHAIEIRETYPDGACYVTSCNRAWMARTYETMAEVVADTNPEEG
jgi:hypothetical protein